jgi:tetratricopeptide (TPR) repeat protein
MLAISVKLTFGTMYGMKEYSRIITDVFPLEKSLALVKRGWKYLSSLTKHYVQFVLTLLILLSLALLWQLYVLSSGYYQAKVEREYATKRLEYWINIIEDHPNFPDAHFQAAAYSYALGDNKKAREFLDRALYLDPEFKNAMELRNKL